MNAPAARQRALITGASAGIGRDLARVFAREGFDLVLVARREDRLEALANELAQAHGTHALVLAEDLLDPGAPTRLYDATEGSGFPVDVLVNNAGFSVPGGFTNNTWAQQESMVRIHVLSVTELCYRFVPSMKARGYGRIMNVASLAGLLPGTPGGTMYPAAKAFLVKFSESLSAELAGSGVVAQAFCPGFTFTEFHDVAGTRENVSSLPKWMWMDGPAVAEEGFTSLLRGDVVYVPGTLNRGIASLASLLPAKVARKLMTRQRRNVID